MSGGLASTREYRVHSGRWYRGLGGGESCACATATGLLWAQLLGVRFLVLLLFVFQSTHLQGLRCVDLSSVPVY